MNYENTRKALEAFKKFVTQQSRSRLSKAGKGGGELYKRLEGDLEVGPNSFSLSWDLGYGIFQDKGVKGADPSKVSKNAKIRGQQAPNSPYKFGSGRFSGTWGKFIKSLTSWVASKRIRLRDEQGRYSKGNYKTIAHIIAKNIYARGLKPTLFFTKPFEQALAKLPNEITEAYALDLESFLQYTIEQDLKNNK